MAMLNFRVVHVGINNDSEEEAEQEGKQALQSFSASERTLRVLRPLLRKELKYAENVFRGAWTYSDRHEQLRKSNVFSFKMRGGVR